LFTASLPEHLYEICNFVLNNIYKFYNTDIVPVVDVILANEDDLHIFEKLEVGLLE
jgi:hypothetical protein